MTFLLYGYAENPRTRLVRIVAAAQGIPIELIEVVPREDINRQLLLDKFPRSNGKIPALEAPGIQLTETLSIVLYLARIGAPTCLLGNGSPEHEAEVVSWMSWANQELLDTLARWFLPLIPNVSRPAPYDKAGVEAGKADSLAMLNTLEDLLSDKTHLVGEQMTLADIFVAVVLSRGLEWVLGAAWRSAHPHCMRHFEMVAGWDPVREVAPHFALVDAETPNVNPYDKDVNESA
ncbi:hypothetical protein E4U42_002267 [Claviceps africana]|uniref:Glutathione S-transferase n=1 Tax=Claviceps africana TaxID=83212 RepID=A0A8K0J8H4_9HYPO|nr:hypothetical protein E4U42_002267 [Claviceps africana]